MKHMAFPNWTGWKTVKLVLALATGLLPIVPPAYSTLATETLAAIASIVVTLSGTSMGPTVTK